MHALRVLLASFSLLPAAVPAQAQPFPTKPIRIIVGFAPGGATDLTARVLAPQMSESLGQSVVVENRPGASGMIGAELVAKARPGQLNFGSGGLGTSPHMSGELFNTMAGLKS